jgi:hypothetical protein
MKHEVSEKIEFGKPFLTSVELLNDIFQLENSTTGTW